MAEKEYIEKRKLIEAWEREIEDATDLRDAFDFALESVPAADVVEVVHAHWIDRDEKTWCSNCDASNKQYKPPYCPHCGARMDGGKEQK